MAQHKWHKEIKAWADGAEIEFYDPDEGWSSIDEEPVFFNHIEYRIKPQPKEPQYLYAWLCEGQVVFTRRFDNIDPRLKGHYQSLGKIKLEVEDGI